MPTLIPPATPTFCSLSHVHAAQRFPKIMRFVSAALVVFDIVLVIVAHDGLSILSLIIGLQSLYIVWHKCPTPSADLNRSFTTPVTSAVEIDAILRDRMIRENPEQDFLFFGRDEVAK